MSQSFKLNLLLGLFVGLIVAVNLIGVKVVTILGVSTSVGIFMIPFTFLITDIIEEVYGQKKVNEFIAIAVIALILALIATTVFVHLPPADRYVESNDSYKTVFGASIRIMIASIVAFTLSQLHDAWMFNLLKKKTKGRFLWLRNNASTMLSQAIDTLIFMFLAFYLVTPTFTAGFIIGLAIPYYLLKISFAALDTPFVYLGVKWLKRGSEDQPVHNA